MYRWTVITCLSPNPSNDIIVSSIYDDPRDYVLEAGMEFLHELGDSNDVRLILNAICALKEALKYVVERGICWMVINICTIVFCWRKPSCLDEERNAIKALESVINQRLKNYL